MITFIIFVFIVILILVSIRPSEVIARWHHHFDNLQLSSQDCYTSLQQHIEKRQIPGAKCYLVTFSEYGGVLSAQRLYFHVRNVTYRFHICAAPYGTGFFVSWWLRESKSLGEILVNKWFPITAQKTYYQLDTQTMFRESVHRAVLNMIEDLTAGKGVRGLSELDQQTITNPKFNFQVKVE